MSKSCLVGTILPSKDWCCISLNSAMQSSKLLCGADYVGVRTSQGRQASHSVSGRAQLTTVSRSRCEHGHIRV